MLQAMYEALGFIKAQISEYFRREWKKMAVYAGIGLACGIYFF